MLFKSAAKSGALEEGARLRAPGGAGSAQKGTEAAQDQQPASNNKAAYGPGPHSIEGVGKAHSCAAHLRNDGPPCGGQEECSASEHGEDASAVGAVP